MPEQQEPTMTLTAASFVDEPVDEVAVARENFRCINFRRRPDVLLRSNTHDSRDIVVLHMARLSANDTSD